MSLEGSRKDFWEIQDSGQDLRFEPRTRPRAGHFDLKLETAASEIKFDPKITGVAKGRQVFIGTAPQSMKPNDFSYRISE